MAAEPTICPECEQPIGVEPHDKCFDAIMSRQAQGVESPDLMPCPACGESMVLPNPDCKDHPS